MLKRDSDDSQDKNPRVPRTLDVRDLEMLEDRRVGDRQDDPVTDQVRPCQEVCRV
ncbi:MAG TPA: hypothetical protein VN729_08500 [Ktedonobacteraceae bacterium]|nr:hypothetical protein [Ktedonobacteraceae bacterium]